MDTAESQNRTAAQRPHPAVQADSQRRTGAKEAGSGTEFWKNSSGSARMMRYVSLLYTGFWVIQPIYEHSWDKWLSFGITYAAFLALYFAIPNTHGRFQRILLAQMFMLAFGYYPFNQSACGVFVYPIVILAFVTGSMRTYVSILTAQSIGILIEAYVFHLQWWTAAMAIFFSLVVGFSNFAYTKQERASWQLRKANDEIEHLAQVAERERIARDLHDLLGHTLTLIAMKSELANRLLPIDLPRAAQEMQEVEQTARKALAEVREAVTGYRSEGIAAEVQRARRALVAAGVQLTVSMEPLELAPAEANVLCLALREGVTNIVRHAHASSAMLRVEIDGKSLRMRLQDDGVGCGNCEGNGLRGMRERVQQAGGSVEVSPARDGKGTALELRLPVRQTAAVNPALAAEHATVPKRVLDGVMGQIEEPAR
ncbi:sensor histidine kinase [Terriglobus aquaticus]|uniref:Sensor histidine kinase n=1 Tax=Terriglobus aquaticus TaxID=940139 RepID=A0ABW9KFL1_9BACT|nr:sensor histidine kinase [Terriglobus aquaticus]